MHASHTILYRVSSIIAVLVLIGLMTSSHGAPQQFANEVLQDAPVGYWRLNERRLNEPAADSSGNGNDGTYDDPCIPLGQPGLILGQPGLGGGDRAVRFTGEVCIDVDGLERSARIDVPASPTLDIRHVTIEALISWAGPNSNRSPQRILEKKQFVTVPPLPPSAKTTYGLIIEDDGRVRVELSTALNEFEPPLVSNKPVPQGVATHVAMTYDGSTIAIYIDGDLDSAKPPERPGDLTSIPEFGVTIGNIPVPDNPNPAAVDRPRPFNGIIDEVALYDRALLAEDIQAHFAAFVGCTLSVEASVTAGTLTIELQVGTREPATWNAWLTAQDDIARLFSISLPVIEPSISVPLSLPFFPALGTIGVLTTLTTPDKGIICAAFTTVDTGPPMAVSLPLKELVEPHAVKLHDQLRQQHIR